MGIFKELFLTWGGGCHWHGQVIDKPAGSLITFHIRGHHRCPISWGHSHEHAHHPLVLTLGSMKKNHAQELLLIQTGTWTRMWMQQMVKDRLDQ